MLRIFKAQFIGNFTHRFVGIKCLGFGKVNNFVLNVFLCCFASFFLDQIAKIVGRQMKFVSKISHSGQADILGFV